MNVLPAGLAPLGAVRSWLVFVEDYDATKHHNAGGYNKLPYSAVTLSRKAWNTDLTDFASAAARIGQPVAGTVHTAGGAAVPATVSGVGFFFGNNSGFIGIDLDEIRGPSGLTAEARQIIAICNSYTEVSPSGRGVHIIISAQGAPDFFATAKSCRKAQNKPDANGGNIGEYQIINTGYMTMTGDELAESKPVRALTPSEWSQLAPFFYRPEQAAAPNPAPASLQTPAPSAAPRTPAPSAHTGTTDRDNSLREIWFKDPTFLQPAADTSLRNGRRMWVCPECKQHGLNGDGICVTPESKDTHPRYICFSCGMCEDVPGLWQKANPGATFDDLRRYYGIDVPPRAERVPLGREDYPDERQSVAASAMYAPSAAAALAAVNDADGLTEYNAVSGISGQTPADMAEYLRRCTAPDMQKIATDYLETCGISADLARARGIGYDNMHQWIVVPTGPASYLTSAIDPNASDQGKYYGPVTLYLADDAAASGKPVTVVGSWLDALAVWQAGGAGVALNGPDWIPDFVGWLKGLPERGRPGVIIGLDGSPADSVAGVNLAELLKAEHLSFYRPGDVCGGADDAAGALARDPAGLAARLQAAEREITKTPAEKYRDQNTAKTCADLLANVDTPRPAIPTGINKLNACLHGGLRSGLYILGAVTSLGKTSLALQIADTIAAGGRDVLYISLEMARGELVSKSLSRISCGICDRRRLGRLNAWDTIDILDGDAGASADKRKVLTEAADIYQNTIAPHFWIFESVGEMTAADIRAKVSDHFVKTQRWPVLVVDYLQIMAAADPKQTDKRNLDMNIHALKQISRDMNPGTGIPVICISSYNRASYENGANIASSSGSGGIEYGADVVLALQYYGTGKKGFDVEDARRQTPRRVELVILKNRNGKTGEHIPLEFTSRLNLFEECEGWPTCGETQIH